MRASYDVYTGQNLSYRKQPTRKFPYKRQTLKPAEEAFLKEYKHLPVICQLSQEPGVVTFQGAEMLGPEEIRVSY